MLIYLIYPKLKFIREISKYEEGDTKIMYINYIKKID